MTTHILKGRSIDGTVYCTEYGWTSSIYEATHYTMDEAHDLMKGQVATNRMTELDDNIGQLEILPIPEKVKIRHQVIGYLVEGNSKEDLAMQLCEALAKIPGEYEMLVKEMQEFHEEMGE